MKTKLFFPAIIYCLQVSAQQSTISGVVSIFNSETQTGKRQYVSNAQVEDYFSKAQPTITNENGQFKLIFVGVNEKESVSFLVKKTGLQVVNTDALSAIAGQNDILKISMADPDSIAAYRRKIYNVGKTEAEKYQERLVIKINRELTNLKKNGLQNKTKIDQLEAELAQSEKQRKKIEEQAQDLANRYAPVNLDDASSLFRKAFLLFQKGNLDSAQLLLKQANLPGKIDSILLEEKKIEQAKKAFAERDSLKNKRKKDCAEALQLKADLHKTSYQFDSASFCYEELIRLDSLNINYVLDYAFLLQWLNQHDKAITYYLRGLEIYKLSSISQSQTYERYFALVQNNLGLLYFDKNDYVKAEAAYLEALDVYRRLAKINPVIYERYVVSIQNNLGVLYSNKNDYTKAEAAYQEALDVYNRLAKADPQTYEPDIAGTQVNLGILYRAKNDFIKAEAAYLEALEVYKRLAITNPETFELYVAHTQHNLGILYSDKNDYQKAATSYLEALDVYRRFAGTNPQTYEPNVAMLLNNLGLNYSDQNDFVKAEAALMEALEIRRRLAGANPQTYDRYIASTLNNLGILYTAKNDYDKAEAAYLEALEIRKRLAKENPQTYELDVARTLGVLGRLYLIMKKHEAAEILLIESLNIQQKWVSKYPEVYARLINQTSMVLLALYSAMLDTLKYNAFRPPNQDNFETIEVLLIDQSKKNPEIAKELSNYYGNRSWYLLFALKFIEAEHASKEGLLIDSTHTPIKPNLAHSLLFQGKYDDALKIYQEIKSLKNEEGKSYAAICLEDLDELEKNGVTHKDVDKIRTFLKE